MKLGKYLFWFIIFAVILTPILDIVLGRNYDITLPNGYSLNRVQEKEMFMTDSDDTIVISPNIDEYKVSDDIVIGHVSVEDVQTDNTGYSKPGYFLVDTQTDEIKQGLREGVWRGTFSRYGIDRDYELSKPSVLDEYLSRNGPKLLKQRFKELISKVLGSKSKPDAEE